MATLKGGIFSRPAGKTGGLVFGAARTRQGKLVTSRLLVPPSNPQTPAQVLQRNKFSESLNTVRRWSPSIYKTDFNRSVGQLPGFQSMESILLTQIDSSLNFSFITPVNLGTLHFPNTVSLHTNSGGELEFNFSTENGDNGTANDIPVIILVTTSPTNRNDLKGVAFTTVATRSTGAVLVPDLLISGQAYQSYLYFRGAGVAAGLLSVANPFTVTVV